MGVAYKSDPARSFVAVSPSDTVDLASGCIGLYVGTAGAVAVVPVGGSTAVNFVAVPAGTTLKIQCRRVNSTGTAASNIVALF